MASYDGVLMPVETLRQLETDQLNAKLYKEELTKHEAEIPLYTAPDGSTLVLVGVGSALVGFLIGALAH